jgi:hypothetical protein
MTERTLGSILKINMRANGPIRAVFGFCFGLAILLAVMNFFPVNNFDFDNIQRGVSALTAGGNPWAAETRLQHFYNPPFSVLFLWPLLFATPKLIIALGGALLIALIFHLKSWVAFAWFMTNSFLFVLATGSIDMYVVGAGLLLLLAGDNESLRSNVSGLALRVLAYGMLMVKPQGGLFIVALYILWRRDWKGLLGSLILYGLFFARLYPDWINVMLHDPPQAQNVAAHSLMKRFGPIAAGLIAIGVILSRKWKYWQLGGALAGILSPYGMPGVPIFLVLTAVNKLIAIPLIVIYSACLALMTWIYPPPGVDYYAYLNPLMAIYHLSMLGLAVVLACYMPGHGEDDGDAIDIAGRVKSIVGPHKLSKPDKDWI